MSQTLVIKVPDELEQKLLQKANERNISLESLVLESLNQIANSPNQDYDDPLLPLLGRLNAQVRDLTYSHRQATL